MKKLDSVDPQVMMALDVVELMLSLDCCCSIVVDRWKMSCSVEVAMRMLSCSVDVEVQW